MFVNSSNGWNCGYSFGNQQKNKPYVIYGAFGYYGFDIFMLMSFIEMHVNICVSLAHLRTLKLL